MRKNFVVGRVKAIIAGVLRVCSKLLSFEKRRVLWFQQPIRTLSHESVRIIVPHFCGRSKLGVLARCFCQNFVCGCLCDADSQNLSRKLTELLCSDGSNSLFLCCVMGPAAKLSCFAQYCQYISSTLTLNGSKKISLLGGTKPNSTMCVPYSWCG